MFNSTSGLAINAAVVEKMAGIAATEVEGVESLAKKTADIKQIINRNTVFKPVKVETKNGTIEIDIYVCVKENAQVKQVAENVQVSVKEKLQNMTGNAVTHVNVFVADVALEQA